ncbi:Rrf2 family transcriptional regulator [Halomonas binhaiensis]|uniref:Rrf2 family transcriptional regulator n=1 Tax=Halomonas binhaiensis TaxID=2562282 RepID=A0A5C1NK84_9GAMM|nr:Rrf2 family transcriptional regulator [Halomonas binhaiensis]QEM83190.1 Rrf2 family transcriptional regulator [Halomonas binhaiensis]
MRLTTKGRYAVTAMLDMAVNDDGDPICLADIACRQQISLSYLEQLFARLRRAGLVESVRGPGGGYLLTESPDAISVARVIEAVNESVDSTRCGGQSDCQQGSTCLTHHLWFELSERIQDFLDNVTLGELAKRQDVTDIAVRQRHRQVDNGILASAP